MPSILEVMLAAAESAVGVNYQWGGNSLATGVDCSGLVQQAYRAAGIDLPRVSNAQAKFGSAVSWDEMKPGDLIWMDYSSRNDGADHIAIYVGNGMMIEAPSKGKQVQVVPVPPPESRRVPMGVTRINIPMEVEATPRAGVALGPNQGREFTQAALGISARDGVSAYQEGGGQPGTRTVAAGDPFATPGAAPSPTAPESIVVAGSPGGGMGDGLPENATETETLAYIRERLPEFSAWLDNDEVRYVLTWGVRESKGVEEIRGALRQTEYFRSHGPQSREFDRVLSDDPELAQQMIRDAKQRVGNILSQNGITVDDVELGEIAKTSIRDVWDDGDLNKYVADRLRWDAAASGDPTMAGDSAVTGNAGFSADQLGVVAADYFVPLTKADLNDWSLRIMAGTETQQSFVDYVAQMSRGQFGNDADVLAAIDRGVSPAQFFAPIRNTIADTLELAPEQVDLFKDPRFQNVVQMYDSNAKQRRAMTMGEAAQWARNQFAYAETDQYQEKDASMTIDLLREFGAIA